MKNDRFSLVLVCFIIRAHALRKSFVFSLFLYPLLEN